MLDDRRIEWEEGHHTEENILNADEIIKLFEELGFERRHKVDNIDDKDISSVRMKDANGFYVKAGSANISTSYDLVVLNEDVDTGNDGTAVAEVAAAYREGTFIDGKVKYNNSGTMAPVTAAHKVVLRLFGIKFNQSVESAGTFQNGPALITYKANNGASPAEADVVIETARGGSYTVLNNTDSKLGFTAPATKAFSKWNTKADGSGTDYAAAASYTANADLTLYAVWA